MSRHAWLVGVIVAAGLTGCVERRYVITTDPPGAMVLRNYQNIGAAPADDFFVYYGNYHFTLIKDGYATMQVDQDIPTPWYEYFPLDFVSENLFPWRIKDVHRFHYKLEPLQPIRSEEIINRAGQLRNRGQTLTPPPSASQTAPLSPPLPLAVPVQPPAPVN